MKQINSILQEYRKFNKKYGHFGKVRLNVPRSRFISRNLLPKRSISCSGWFIPAKKLTDWYAGLTQLLTIGIVEAGLFQPPIVNNLRKFQTFENSIAPLCGKMLWNKTFTHSAMAECISQTDIDKNVVEATLLWPFRTRFPFTG